MNDQAASGDTVPFQYQGREHAVPVRLIDLQRAWSRADATCTRLHRVQSATDEYERAWGERMRLTLAKQDDPWLTESGAFSHAKDAMLRAAACEDRPPTSTPR